MIKKELLPSVLSLESLLIKAANGEKYDDDLDTIEHSCYASDLDFASLRRLLVEVVKQGNVHEVTSIRTICDAMNTNPPFKQILYDIHKLLRL